jgi:Zn-finger nucleic acid-binding protein
VNCPVCQTALTIAERQSVEIDYCPKCRGVWLDRGELDKIMERASRELGAAPAPRAAYGEEHRRYDDDYRRYDDDRRRYDDDYDPRRRRRKSFLNDLFDFD